MHVVVTGLLVALALGLCTADFLIIVPCGPNRCWTITERPLEAGLQFIQLLPAGTHYFKFTMNGWRPPIKKGH